MKKKIIAILTIGLIATGCSKAATTTTAVKGSDKSTTVTSQTVSNNKTATTTAKVTTTTTSVTKAATGDTVKRKFQAPKEGGVESFVELEAKGNQVVKQTITTVTKFADMGLNTPEAKKSYIDIMSKAGDYKTKGMTMKVTHDDNQLNSITEMDYTQMDLSSFSKMPGAQGKSKEELFSLKAICDEFIKLGYKEIK